MDADPPTTDRFALVLGASGKIGGDIARHLHDQGFPIAVHTRHRPPDAAVPSDPPRYTADLTEWSEVSDFSQRVLADLGPPMTVVNCTGSAADSLLVTQPPQDWMGAVTANIACAYHPVRAFLPAMLRTGTGSFVFTSSAATAVAAPGQSAYAAAKAALETLVRSLANEYQSTGIRFNAVAPGFVESGMTTGMPAAARRRALQRQARSEPVPPDDVATATSFLISVESVTGHVLRVDHGAGAH